jgi:hypothetical protein
MSVPTGSVRSRAAVAGIGGRRSDLGSEARGSAEGRIN